MPDLTSRQEMIIQLLKKGKYEELNVDDWMNVIKSILREEIERSQGKKRHTPMTESYPDLGLTITLHLKRPDGSDEYHPMIEMASRLERLDKKIKEVVSDAFSRLIGQTFHSSSVGNEEALYSILSFGCLINQGLKRVTIVELNEQTRLPEKTKRILRSLLDPAGSEGLRGRIVIRK